MVSAFYLPLKVIHLQGILNWWTPEPVPSIPTYQIPAIFVFLAKIISLQKIKKSNNLILQLWTNNTYIKERKSIIFTSRHGGEPVSIWNSGVFIEQFSF